jgi:hypothetical protein
MKKKEVIIREDLIRNEDLTNKYVVLMGKYFRGDDVRRVFRCEGGFGCSPNTIGRAVFGTLVSNGTKFRSERFEVERFATEEEVKEAEKIREDEKKLIVMFKDNWSDEFDVEGFKLFNGLQWKQFREIIESKVQFPARGYFGTNEFLEFVDIEDYFDHFKVNEIPELEFGFISELFPNGFGHFETLSTER